MHSLSLDVSLLRGLAEIGHTETNANVNRGVSYSREVMTCEIGEGMCIQRWLRFATVSRSHTGGILILMLFDLGDSHTKILYCTSETVERDEVPHNPLPTGQKDQDSPGVRTDKKWSSKN